MGISSLMKVFKSLLTFLITFGNCFIDCDEFWLVKNKTIEPILNVKVVAVKIGVLDYIWMCLQYDD